MKKAKPPSDGLSALGAPWLFAYHSIGSRIERKILPHFENFGVTLQRAGFKISLLSYVSLMILFSGISLTTSFVMTGFAAILFGTPIVVSLIYAFGVAIFSALLVFGALYFVPSLLATTRKRKIELELPFVTTHMSILAAAGIPPTRMFKMLEDSITTPEVASEANEIVRDVEILGDDIITALEKERHRSPSPRLNELLEGLVATIRSGGDTRSFLLDSTRTIMDYRRISAKQLVETLAAFAEVYVELLVVFPLLIIVMFSVMALIGNGLGGFSVTTMMVFVSYLVIPLCAVAVLVMLDGILVED
jgi:archaellum biogenesis protein FlaJ (TadC family)